MSPANALSAVPVSKIPPLIPGRPSIQTIWRWILNGVRGPDGQQIKLASFKVAGRRFVTRQAIDDFIAAWSVPSSARPAPSTEAAALRRSREAANALENLGA